MESFFVHSDAQADLKHIQQMIDYAHYRLSIGIEGDVKDVKTTINLQQEAVAHLLEVEAIIKKLQKEYF